MAGPEGSGRLRYRCLWIEGVYKMSREIKEACNHLHLALPSFQSAFRQALLGSHAADVVVEDETCRQDWQWSAMREVHGWLVNRDM